MSLLEKLPFTSNRIINKVHDMNSLPGLTLGSNQSNKANHSEVLGLLGPAWQANNLKVLKIINDLISFILHT